MQILTDTIRLPAKGDRSDAAEPVQSDFPFEMALQDDAVQTLATPSSAVVPTTNHTSAKPLDDLVETTTAPLLPSAEKDDEKLASNAEDKALGADLSLAPQYATTTDFDTVPLAMAAVANPIPENQSTERDPKRHVITIGLQVSGALSLAADTTTPASDPDHALPESRLLAESTLSARSNPFDAAAKNQTRALQQPHLQSNIASPVLGQPAATALGITRGQNDRQQPSKITIAPPQEAAPLSHPHNTIQSAPSQPIMAARLIPPLDSPIEHLSQHRPSQEQMFYVPVRCAASATGPTTRPMTAFGSATGLTEIAPTPLQTEVAQFGGTLLQRLAISETKTALFDSQTPARPPPTPTVQAAQSIIQLAQSDAIRTTELTLSPEDLGKLRFEIATQDDRLTVRLYAERPETLELLRRQSDLLLAELRQAGYAQSSLSFGSWGQNRNTPSAAKDPFALAEAGTDHSHAPQAIGKAAPSLGNGRLHIRL